MMSDKNSTLETVKTDDTFPVQVSGIEKMPEQPRGVFEGIVGSFAEKLWDETLLQELEYRGEHSKYDPEFTSTHVIEAEKIAKNIPAHVVMKPRWKIILGKLAFLILPIVAGITGSHMPNENPPLFAQWIWLLIFLITVLALVIIILFSTSPSNSTEKRGA